MPHEFDCVECGRHIIRYCGPEFTEVAPLCAACIHIPGWFRMPEIRVLIDPDVRPPEFEDYEDATQT